MNRPECGKTTSERKPVKLQDKVLNNISGLEREDEENIYFTQSNSPFLTKKPQAVQSQATPVQTHEQSYLDQSNPRTPNKKKLFSNSRKSKQDSLRKKGIYPSMFNPYDD